MEETESPDTPDGASSAEYLRHHVAHGRLEAANASAQASEIKSGNPVIHHVGYSDASSGAGELASPCITRIG